MYENVHYQKPFLQQVVFRADYASAVGDIARNLPPMLYEAALSRYPIAEPKALPKGIQVNMGKAPEVIAKGGGTHWLFHGERREKTLSLAPTHIDITYREYHAYEDLRSDCEAILNQLSSVFPSLQAKRVGLRYINNITLREVNPLEWDAYIQPQFLAGLDVAKNRDQLARVFHNVVINRAGLLINCQYGLHNPDFPAPIRQKQFILDFDASKAGPTDLNTILTVLDDGHEQIQALFESSITDALRARLNGTAS